MIQYKVIKWAFIDVQLLFFNASQQQVVSNSASAVKQMSDRIKSRHSQEVFTSTVCTYFIMFIYFIGYIY